MAFPNPKPSPNASWWRKNGLHSSPKNTSHVGHICLWSIWAWWCHLSRSTADDSPASKLTPRNSGAPSGSCKEKRVSVCGKKHKVSQALWLLKTQYLRSTWISLRIHKELRSCRDLRWLRSRYIKELLDPKGLGLSKSYAQHLIQVHKVSLWNQGFAWSGDGLSLGNRWFSCKALCIQFVRDLAETSTIGAINFQSSGPPVDWMILHMSQSPQLVRKWRKSPVSSSELVSWFQRWQLISIRLISWRL